MEAGSPQNLGFLGVKDAIDKIMAQIEFAPKLPEKLDLLLKRLRLVISPGHPGPQVIKALIDSSL
jgi:hypothetical protein